VPTYSYRCANCDFAFDQYQAFTDESLTVCPDCGQSQLRKVFNSIGVSFTGSGFYRNDSRAETTKAAAGSSSEATPATKSEAPTATASKSETKAPKSPPPKTGAVSSNSPSGPSGS
jgi:putative FmdB family regulatory protein